MEWLAIAGGVLVLIAVVLFVRWGMNRAEDNIYDDPTAKAPSDPVATADVANKISGGGSGV